MTEVKFYEYWRSSAAYRVRLALKIKNVPYTSVAVHLAKGEQHADDYRAKNPMTAVPMLEFGNMRLTQSLAIIEYLEEIFPSPSLMPVDAEQRAFARSIAQLVTSDIHPLNNLRVLQYLTGTLKVAEDVKNMWYAHWLKDGLTALEKMVSQHSYGSHCIGNTVSIADICLIPQLYNARRYKFPLDDYPTLLAIEAHCAKIPAFAAAKPELQPGAELAA